MAKGHRVVSETGGAGGGGRSIPSPKRATVQPRAEGRASGRSGRARGVAAGACEPSHRHHARSTRSEPDAPTVTGSVAVTVRNAPAAAQVAGCDGVTVENTGPAPRAPVPAPDAGAGEARLRGAAAREAIHDAPSIVPMILTAAGAP